MKTRRISKLLFLCITAMIMLSMSITVFAASDTDLKIALSPNDKEYVTQCIKAAEVASGSAEKITSATGTEVTVKSKTGDSSTPRVALFKFDGTTLTFSAENFKAGNDKEVKKAMTAFMNKLKETSMSADTQQEIMTQIQASDPKVAPLMMSLIFDTGADMYTAYKWLSPFLQVLRVVFGVGAILIILLLLGSTIMDLCYIGLPVWREAQAEKSGTNGHSSSKKPFGVSYDALATVKEVEEHFAEGYKNAYIVYFKRRALTYIVLAVSVLYLVVGELGGLISWVLSLASGVVG